MPAKVPAEFINQVGTKNAIINGDMRIAQRGTSFISPIDGQYLIDRFRYIKSGSMTFTMTQEIDSPSDNFRFSLKADCTTSISATPAASDRASLDYYVEGHDFQAFNNKLVTLSFWVKATKTGIYCVSFRNAGVDRSYIDEYVVNSADTWEKKSITLTIDTTSGTWDFVSGRGLLIAFMMVAGSDYFTTKGIWQVGSFRATSNQVNVCDNVVNNFQITGVQLELGSSASDFEHLNITTEIALCLRYYEKSYNIDVDPGTATGTGALAHRDTGVASAKQGLMQRFAVQKRVLPTLIWYNPETGAINNIRNVSAGGSNHAVIGSGLQGTTATGYPTVSSTGTINHHWRGHWTADAEL